MNVTNVFISEACEALRWKTGYLSDKEKEELCNKLVNLCMVYTPGVFKNTEKENT